MAANDDCFLVSTSLSSLGSQQPTSIPIQTTRRETPLPPNPHDSDIHPEHATNVVVLNTKAYGTIVLRLLHGGLIAELISASYNVPPVRFIFPSLVLPNAGLFLSDSTSLHILAVTTFGSLFRLVIPLDGKNLWQHQGDVVWPHEYHIANFPDTETPLVHIEGTHSVSIALSNGSLLRLEASFNGEEAQEDEWSETMLHHGSFLSSLTSLLPLHSGSPNSADIISIASHPWPTDLSYVWTLARDRTLRLWKAKVGCISSKNLTPHGTQVQLSPGSTTGLKHPLLDASPQTLLKVFPNDDRVYVLAFIPTVSSTTSGGVFKLLETFSDQLHDIATFDGSRNTVYCHLQDFIILKGVVYALWERQGKSMVEKSNLPIDEANEDFRPDWQIASYANEPELTPTYMEEQLLTPGSLTDKYLEAVLRPGVFSSLTLKTAIDQYTEACLSLPGAPPPQLTANYATVEEQIASVVGCTVNLNRDPHTGAPQHAAYWVALKRDWEGFIARCREVERHARWPLVLGVKEEEEVLIVERERIGLLVTEDLPIQVQRQTRSASGSEPQFDLLTILWKLRSEVGPQVMTTVQDRIADILHQEIAFSFIDILLDSARRVGFRENVAGGVAEWFSGRLQSVGDLDGAIRTALDLIGGFDSEIKREEDDSGLAVAENQSELLTGLTVAYIGTSISARYDLCLSLCSLLFFIADELPAWKPSLLAEVFAVFRGIAILRQIVNQPARSPKEQRIVVSDRSSADDMILRLRNMNFSNADTASVLPRYSLVYLLLSQADRKTSLPSAAHRFLDSTGLLRSISPANVTPHEILLCEKIRLLGSYDVAWDLLAWLPRTPAVVFVLANVWLELGRPADAAELLEKLAASFGSDNAILQEDKEALVAVIPSARLFESPFTFYLHVSEMCRDRLLVYYEVQFAQLAISVAPADADTSSLWSTVIRGYLDLEMWDDAYAALMATPYEKQKREYVSQLTFQMCESEAIDTLMSFDFAGVVDEVEAALSFKGRNADPKSRPAYAHILYAWYVQRSNYRNAALTMYQHAQKLAATVTDVASFAAIAQLELEAYVIAINALSLVESRSAWVIVPKSSNPNRSRKTVLNRIPDARYSSRKYDAEIVHLTDMQYECTLLRAQIDIIRKDPTLLKSQEFLLPPTLVVMRLANMNFYDQALTIAHTLNVDMTDVFTQLTTQCLRLSRDPNSVIQEDADWLLTDQVSSWSRTPAERAWSYLQQALQRHDGAQTDHQYSKTVLETILTFDRNSIAPPWLIKTLENHQPEYLIRTMLRYERLDLAIAYSLSMIRKSGVILTRQSPRNACSSWLPYNLLDQILVAAAEQDKPPAHLTELRSELNNRFNRVQKLSHN